jgi:hypothetical protein
MRTVRRALVPGCMALSLMLWTSPLHAKTWAGTWKLNLEKSPPVEEVFAISSPTSR